MKPELLELESRITPSSLQPSMFALWQQQQAAMAAWKLNPTPANFAAADSALVQVSTAQTQSEQAMINATTALTEGFAAAQVSQLPPVPQASQAKVLSQPAPMPTHPASSLASLDAAGIAAALGIGSK